MQKNLRLKFICAGQQDDFMKKRVLKDFYIGQDVEIVDDDSYDFLVCINSVSQTPRVPREKTIGVIMEPSWSHHVDKNLSQKCGTIFVHDNSLFGFSGCNIIERPSLMFNEFYTTDESIDFYRTNQFKKTKKISFVVSSIRGSGSHILYDKRYELAKEIIRRRLPVDIYGRGWIANGDRIKGPLREKRESLIDYEFSIGVENCAEKNYISEKLFDNFLVNTVPVYTGCPNVEEIYNKDSFIGLNLDDQESCISTIEKILEGEIVYDSFSIKIKDSKERYIEEHNLITEILKHIQ